jgi:hypothetical protein
VPVFNVASGVTGHGGGSGSGFGANFVVNQPLTVTALGMFDSANASTSINDGFSGNLVATLYNASGTALASITFTPSTPGTLAPGSSFRLINLATPLSLPAGFHGSIVGSGFTTADPFGTSDAGDPNWTFTGSPALSIDSPRSRYGTGYPTNGSNSYFLAATFTYSSAATPEPGTVGLMAGLGVTGLGMAFRARRRRRA